jgi:hypothetical protein
MPVEVSCPGCGSKLKIPENMTGKKGKCKKCTTSFRIPGPAAAGDSVGESQMLSVISTPAPSLSNEDESIPMATAVEEADLPLPSPPAPPVRPSAPVASDVASLPSADPFDFTAPVGKNTRAAMAAKPPAPPPTVKTVAKPSSNAAKVSPPPTPVSPPARSALKGVPPKSPPVSPPSGSRPAITAPPPPPPETLSPDDEPPPIKTPPAPKPTAADDPFSFTSSPEPAPRDEPKAKGKKNSKSGNDDRDEVKPKPQSKMKRGNGEEADPFATPFSPAPETVTVEEPFSFNSDPSPSAKTKGKKQNRDEDVDAEKTKIKDKQKARTREDERKQEMLPEPEPSPEPMVSSDPFSFNVDPIPSSRAEPRTKSNRKYDEEDEDEQDANAKSKKKGRKDDEPEDHGGRRYVRRGAQKSNKVLLLAGVLGLLVIGGGIAAVVVFMKKDSEQAKKATEKKEEPAPTPPPDPPKDDTKTSKKDPSKKDPSRKDPGDSLPKDPKITAEQTPIAIPMLALPAKLKTYEFRAPKNKPASVQQPSQQPIQVEVSFEKVKLFFPSPNRVSNDAVVVWQSNPGFNGRGERLSVDTYNGSTGFKADRFEFDGDGKDAKCDVSFDGKVFAAAVDGKVTVWNLANKSKALEGFDPYADKPAHKKAGLAAVFIPNNSNNFLTVSTAGAMHLFEIETKKQIGEYIPENGTPGRVALGKNLAAEETRSSVVVAIGGSIHQVSTLAPLSLSWKLPLQGEVGRSFGLSVAGTPGRIAYAFETDADKKKDRAILFCMPNNDPTVFRWQDSAGEPVSVSWAGTEFAVVGTTRGVVWFEYDSEGKNFTPLAMAQVPNDKGFHETTERAHWYLIPNPKDPAKSLMLELATPIADLIEFRNAAAAKQQLETLRLDDNGLWR